MQSIGTHQYNTSNSQQPHNHPTPQSPPGPISATNGHNNSMSTSSNKITSPHNNPPITTNSLPTPRSPIVDANQNSGVDDMDLESSDPLNSSLKRRRGAEDTGEDDRPRKSRSLSRDPNDMELDIEPLYADQASKKEVRTVPTMEELLAMPSTGPPSWLNKTRHYASKPMYTMPLLEVYGLQEIAASVARKDADGNKVNKLRKSYKGKVTHLSGKVDVVITPQQFYYPAGPTGPGFPQSVKGGLLEILDVPEEEWRNQKVIGKEVPRSSQKDGQSVGKEFDMNAFLKGWGTMAKGPLTDYDASWLAINEKVPNTQPSGQHQSLSSTSALASTTPAASGSPNGINTVSPDPQNNRASRKRRRDYREGAWEGYGEEYEGTEGGSGYDDEETRKKKKKKRKIPEYDDHVSGVGMNMAVNHAVGVGVGGGYYQR